MKRFGMMVLMASALAACGGSRPVVRPAPQPVDSALAAATFDSAWTLIHRSHFDPTFNGVDWVALRGELRPRAVAAHNVGELRGVIVEMLGRLRQSHFYVIPGEVDEAITVDAAEVEDEEEGDDAAAVDSLAVEADEEEDRPGDLGLDVRLVDGRFVVTRVERGGAAEAAGVRPGWVIDAVGKASSTRILEAIRAVTESADPRTAHFYAVSGLRGALVGPVGTTVTMRFLDAADRRVTLRLARRPVPGELSKFGNLPEVPTVLEWERLTGEDGTVVGVIRFNIWLPALSRRFDEALDRLRDADGIVIDLRGNPGGAGGMAMGVGGHFTPARDTLGTMITRQQRLYFITNPRRVDTQSRPVEPYAGPVAILTDALSVSTSEIFAGGMQKIGRARVFGETTQGAALPALMQKLPNGDVLVHAFANFTGPNGEAWEGAGVVPDEPAPPTREALLAGRDPALDAARRWIAGQKRRGNP
ncbi:MAG TPA: S41 family peptidase [Longimicrobiaceae bacterium]|nr:S41 family peptidase [Longimicrobiaceae bacterium]